MKILHTSDLHLGKNLLEESLFEDQKLVLEDIIKIIKEKNIDVVLIAGDIYDKSIPSVDAVNLFDNFLFELSKIKTEVLIISGNHDSNDRLSFGSKIFDNMNIHIETEYTGKLKKYSFDDVDFYMLPFVKPFHIKKYMTMEEYENVNSSNEMMKWILKNEKIDKSRKNIIMLHQFVMNAGDKIEFSDSESQTNVGTLDAIDVNLFDDFDYVALGHIHRGQKIKRDTVRYSGTPLKYSFSEVNNKNGVIIYDTDNKEYEIIEINPLRKMRVIRGYFDDIMKMDKSDDLIRIELLDENNIISPMDDLKKKFPNALSLAFISNKANDENIFNTVNNISENETPFDLFNDFFEYQNGRKLNDNESKYLNNIINMLGGEE